MAWKIKRLGDVCDVVGGGTPKTGVPAFWGGDIVWVTPKDLGRLNSFEIF
jgi:type I restriction enzyme S subunit